MYVSESVFVVSVDGLYIIYIDYPCTVFLCVLVCMSFCVLVCVYVCVYVCVCVCVCLYFESSYHILARHYIYILQDILTLYKKRSVFYMTTGEHQSRKQSLTGAARQHKLHSGTS